MGALHAGHMALIDAAKAEADRVVASIFVNPLQFGPNEDLDRYPRQEAEDAELLEEAGLRPVVAADRRPALSAGIFDHGERVGRERAVGRGGAAGHFDGVATVVAKLFAAVRPDLAFFGEKDFQQLAVIRRMAIDLGAWR